MAGIISVGSLLSGLYLTVEQMFLIPLFMGVTLAILAAWIYVSYLQKIKTTDNRPVIPGNKGVAEV